MNGVTSQADAAAAIVEDLQNRICTRVSALESGAAFTIDNWQSPGASGSVGGRGSTRVIADGAAIEKGGVNTSIVTGSHLPPSLLAQRPELEGCGFFAAGVSVVIHPRNPHAPTSHCNFRYFEARRAGGERAAWWFGGGADLTPYYPRLEDVRHFHASLRSACDAHDPSFYPAFKSWCDRYFYLKHRDETRGVGGIFYDYLDETGYGESAERHAFATPQAFDALAAFMNDAGQAYIDGYFPIVERRMDEPYSQSERNFQLLRRGRYVEFNLLYDRGTLFGLQSGGRVESILMSLPSLVRWAYDERPEPGSREAELAAYLTPRDWFAQDPFAS